MNDRGFTILELILAAAIGVVILIAMGSLYLTTVKYERLNDELAWVQREGTMILEKMGREIRGSTEIKCSPLASCDPVATDPASTCGVDPSLQVTTAAGAVCFRTNTTNGNDLLQGLFGGTQVTMLKGTPVAMQVSACPGVPMFSVINPSNDLTCSPVTTPCAPPNRVDICFQIGTTRTPPDSMVFRASFTKRN